MASPHPTLKDLLARIKGETAPEGVIATPVTSVGGIVASAIDLSRESRRDILGFSPFWRALTPVLAVTKGEADGAELDFEQFNFNQVRSIVNWDELRAELIAVGNDLKSSSFNGRRLDSKTKEEVSFVFQFDYEIELEFEDFVNTIVAADLEATEAARRDSEIDAAWAQSKSIGVQPQKASRASTVPGAAKNKGEPYPALPEHIVKKMKSWLSSGCEVIRVATGFRHQVCGANIGKTTDYVFSASANKALLFLKRDNTNMVVEIHLDHSATQDELRTITLTQQNAQSLELGIMVHEHMRIASL